jgi:hypothetical protein
MAPSARLLFWSWFDVHPWLTERRTPAWIEYRFRHWLAYTLPSILGQDEADFRYWLVCDPEGRALTEPLRASIRDDRVELVYADECPARFQRLPGAERHLLARLDSDDMYHPSVAGKLLSRRARTEFLQFNDGYACDLRSGAMREWKSHSSPFYCHVYGDDLRRRSAWEEPDHTTVRPWATVLGGGHFLVALHDRNTSSVLRRGAPVGDALRQRVFAAFGLGGERRLDRLLACACGAGSWSVGAAAFGPGPAENGGMSREAASLFAFVCRMSAARRVLLAGTGAGAVVAEAQGVPCDTLAAPAADGYDLALLDLADGPDDVALLSPLLERLLPSGLLMVDNCHEPAVADALRAALASRCADEYPEVADLTRDARGRHAALFGRVIGPLS